MSLIRRKKKPSPFERVTKVVGLGAKGLAAQRIVRRGLKGYKFTRRAVPLALLGAAGAVIAKKAKGGSDATPPASTTTSSASSAPTSTAAAAAATSTAVPQPTNGGAPASGDDVPEALEAADVSGEGPDTPEEAAEEATESKKRSK